MFNIYIAEIKSSHNQSLTFKVVNYPGSSQVVWQQFSSGKFDSNCLETVLGCLESLKATADSDV